MLSKVVATPTVTVLVTSPVASANGSAKALTTRSAAASTAAVSLALPISSANSSPPRRHPPPPGGARRVRAAHQLVEAARRLHQEFIADAVAQGVVDDLEVIEV